MKGFIQELQRYFEEAQAGHWKLFPTLVWEKLLAHPPFLLHPWTQDDTLGLLGDLRSESVHVGVDGNKEEGHNQVEDEPDVDHLDVRCHGQGGVDLEQ